MENYVNTPIANMAPIAPKRGYSVATVAKADLLCVFFAKASRFMNVLDIFYSFYTERKSNSERDIQRHITKLHLRRVVKVSSIIKAAFALVLLCIFELAAKHNGDVY